MLRYRPVLPIAIPLALSALLFACAVDDADEAHEFDERAYAEQAGDPVLGEYNFLLEVSGVTPDQKTIIGGFKSLSGMDSETEIIELEQGISPTGGFAAWMSAGATERRDGSVTFLHPDASTKELRFQGAVVETYLTKTGSIAKLRLRVTNVEVIDRESNF
jgi:hypothetical protein